MWTRFHYQDFFRFLSFLRLRRGREGAENERREKENKKKSNRDRNTGEDRIIWITQGLQRLGNNGSVFKGNNGNGKDKENCTIEDK